MGYTDDTAVNLQDDIKAPNIIKDYREQVTKRMKDDKYMLILAMYIDSLSQDFESYLRTEIDLVEDDIRLVLEAYNSSFITYKLEPGIYTFKDLSEDLFNLLQSEYPGPSNVFVIEIDDINMNSKMVVRDGIIAMRFDEKSFYSTDFDFTPGWDYKHYIENISQKFVNLSTTNKIQLKSVDIDGSVLNGIRHLIFFIFVLDKKPGCKVLCEPETFHYKKI